MAKARAAPRKVRANIEAIASRASGRRTRLKKIVWYDREVMETVNGEMEKRTKKAMEHVKGRVVKNISKRVRRRSGRVVERSKPGEFPRADTGQLMRSIFTQIETKKNRVIGRVATPLDYGLILETSPRLDRSFLLRTLEEEKEKITKILTEPMKTRRRPGRASRGRTSGRRARAGRRRR